MQEALARANLADAKASAAQLRAQQAEIMRGDFERRCIEAESLAGHSQEALCSVQEAAEEVVKESRLEIDTLEKKLVITEELYMDEIISLTTYLTLHSTWEGII